MSSLGDSQVARLSNEIKELDSLTSRVECLGVKVDSLTEAVARSKGAVWGRAPLEPIKGRA